MIEIPTDETRRKEISFVTSNFDFVKCKKIGKSVLNRNLISLSVGCEKNQVLWLGAFHGMEWITGVIILKFFKNLCYHIKNDEKIFGVDIKKSLQERGLMVVPFVNPDGIEISISGSEAAENYKSLAEKFEKNSDKFWQANARGVDLNHNYNAGWDLLKKMEISNGITSPASTRFGGEFPESEPETQAIVNLCRKFNFEYAVAFHSQGEEIYWNFGEKIPKNSRHIANKLALSSEYNLSEPEGLAVGGGFKDWFITEFNKPAFTVEVGKGKNPLPISEFDSIYQKIEKMLYISALT